MPFEFFAEHAHSPCHQWNYCQSEESQLPAGEKKGCEVEDDKNGILEQHVQRTGYRVLDLRYVSAHSCYDVSLSLFREEGHRESYDLVVYLCADITDNARSQRYHYCRRTEVARRLYQCDESEEEPQEKEGGGCALFCNEDSYVIICIVHRYVLDRQSAVPRYELIHGRIHLEEDLQDRYDEGE